MNDLVRLVLACGLDAHRVGAKPDRPAVVVSADPGDAILPWRPSAREIASIKLVSSDCRRTWSSVTPLGSTRTDACPHCPGRSPAPDRLRHRGCISRTMSHLAASSPIIESLSGTKSKQSVSWPLGSRFRICLNCPSRSLLGKPLMKHSVVSSFFPPSRYAREYAPRGGPDRGPA